MKKADIHIGGSYWAKVSGRLVIVKIYGEACGKGWNATNTTTGRTVRILTAARLRRPANGTKTPYRPSNDAQGELVALNGQKIVIRCDKENGKVYWMSDWSKCSEFEKRGIFRSHNHGPATYGHVSFYLVSMEERKQ